MIKRILIVLIILSVPCIGAIVIFCCNFFTWPPKISNSVEDWSLTADYFGVILQVLLSIANIAVLFYLTIMVEDYNKDREKQQLKQNEIEKTKEKEFQLQHFNWEQIQSSYRDIYNILKDFDPIDIIDLFSAKKTMLPDPGALSQAKTFKRKLIKLSLEVNYYFENNQHIFEFLKSGHERYPSNQISNFRDSIKSLSSVLDGDLNDERRELCLDQLTNFNTARHNLLRSFESEIRYEIKLK